MGFQVLDDVLDLIGDEERLGKPTGNDIASGVYTLPVLAALQGPEGRSAGGTLTSGGPDRRAVDVALAIELVRRSGAIAEALGAADRFAGRGPPGRLHLNQTTIGEGLGRFPRLYATWSLETLMDRRSPSCRSRHWAEGHVTDTTTTPVAQAATRAGAEATRGASSRPHCRRCATRGSPASAPAASPATAASTRR